MTNSRNPTATLEYQIFDVLCADFLPNHCEPVRQPVITGLLACESEAVLGKHVIAGRLLAAAILSFIMGIHSTAYCTTNSTTSTALKPMHHWQLR